MRGSTALILAGLLLAASGCKKEEAMYQRGAPAEAAKAQPAPLKALGYIGGPAPGDAARSAIASTPSAPSAPAKPVPSPRPRKLVRTVDLRLEVKDSAAVARQIETLITRMGGYVAASNAQRQGELLTYTLTVRVPVDRYDQTLAGIRGYAVRIDREHGQVEDVTDQYVDLDARRRTLEATETELRGLLAESRQRGRKVGEIMEVYQQLIEVRTQIEQIQGQMNTFDKAAALSTINVELVPTEAAKPVADDAWQPSDTVRSSLRSLLGFLRWLLDFLIYALIVLLPVALVIVAAVLAVRWLWRRLGSPFRRGRPGPPPPGEERGVR
jgi:hypothetical protein